MVQCSQTRAKQYNSSLLALLGSLAGYGTDWLSSPEPK